MPPVQTLSVTLFQENVTYDKPSGLMSVSKISNSLTRLFSVSAISCRTLLTQAVTAYRMPVLTWLTGMQLSEKSIVPILDYWMFSTKCISQRQICNFLKLWFGDKKHHERSQPNKLRVAKHLLHSIVKK